MEKAFKSKMIQGYCGLMGLETQHVYYPWIKLSAKQMCKRLWKFENVLKLNIKKKRTKNSSERVLWAVCKLLFSSPVCIFMLRLVCWFCIIITSDWLCLCDWKCNNCFMLAILRGGTLTYSQVRTTWLHWKFTATVAEMGSFRVFVACELLLQGSNRSD